MYMKMKTGKGIHSGKRRNQGGRCSSAASGHFSHYKALAKHSTSKIEEISSVHVLVAVWLCPYSPISRSCGNGNSCFLVDVIGDIARRDMLRVWG